MVILNNRIHLTPDECATKFNVARTTVYYWLKTFNIARERIGANIMIAQDDILAFLAKKKDRRKKGWNKKKTTE